MHEYAYNYNRYKSLLIAPLIEPVINPKGRAIFSHLYEFPNMTLQSFPLQTPSFAQPSTNSWLSYEKPDAESGYLKKLRSQRASN